MKSIVRYILLSMPLLFFAFSLPGQAESFEVLTIKARVTVDDEPLDGITVELYEGNERISHEIVKRGGKLKFDLNSNRIYTLQLRKDGYYTKRISIITRIPEGYDEKETFEFDIGMIARGEEEINDEGLLDYPSALISFHPKYDKFYYDVDYDRALKEDIEEAMVSQ